MTQVQTDSDMYRKAPHSIESEEAVLGSVLIEPDSLWDVAAQITPSDFFIVRNEWVYTAMLDLAQRGDAVDYLTVTDALRQRGQLDDIGGMAYLTYLLNNTPSSLYVSTYAEMVRRTSQRRGLLRAASTLAELAHDQERDTPDILNEAARVVFDTAEDRGSGGVSAIGDLVREDRERVAARRNQPNTIAGVSTGFVDMDRMLGGLNASDLIVLAGRPGMGKTSWAITVTLSAAQRGDPVLFFSIEMGREQAVQRYISQMSSLSVQRIRQGDLTDAEWSAYCEAAGKLEALPIYIDDTPSITPLQMRIKARRAAMAHGVKLIAVDYLQLMDGGSKNTADNRTAEVTYISRQLKIMAREMNVPVLALAQLSRAVENRQNKRPILSDLRDSGSIEQDADIVIFLYRDDYYDENTERPNQIDNIIAKHRNGPTGTVPLFFRAELAQIANLRRQSVDLSQYDGSADSVAPVDFGGGFSA